ncbi:MAG TPA: PVC-type heme-binding CxxCH protein [Gemmataceae bacterium]|nr:PVC-type heme-binding CxxCH protein [Gemmataceae bacterium]
MQGRHKAMHVLILVVLIGASFPCSARAQIRDDREALKTLKVPEGFEIRLFAGADICHNPTAIDVDIYGRVWVAEGMNYRSTFNKGPGPLDPDADRIKVFEDTKGTGRADKVTVFCDKIPIVPMSICVAGDKAFVGVAPELWMFDGASARDPVGKNKSILINGFHHSGRTKPYVDHDHALHGLMLGPDGRVYFTVGNEGMNVTDKSGVKHHPNGGAMVRMNIDGSHMRVLADNFRNPYELCVDSFGRVFCSDNDDDGNAQVRICYVIDGGDYGYNHNPQLPPSPTRHHWREDVPGVTPKILRTFAGSPCGIITYEGKLFPERFHGSLIHCDCGAPQVVRAYHLKPSGAGFTCEIENLLTSTDKWFRPVDVAHAPDGSLYIADWYDSGVGGHGYRDKIIGRIYHLTMKGTPPPAKTPAPDLQTIPGLLSTLMSPMPSIQYLAIQKLRAGGKEAADALAKMAREGRHPLERARALWVLLEMGDLGRPVILEKLEDPDPRFRAQTVRMLREDMAKNLAVILPLAGDNHPEVNLEVAIALREMPTGKTEDALLKLANAADPGDPWYLPTLAKTLRNREPEMIAKLFRTVNSPEAEARALALSWQINRVESIPFLTAVLKAPKIPGHFQKAMEALSWFKDPSAGESVATVALAERDSGRVRLALETLQKKIGSDWKPVAQKPVFDQLFEKTLKNPGELTGMLALIGAAGEKQFVPKVLELIDRPGLDKTIRKAALEALAQMRVPEAMPRLEKILGGARLPVNPPEIPAPTDDLAFAALSALQLMGTPPANKILESLTLDRSYPVDLRREAVKVLGRTTPGCNFLLAAAVKGELPADLKGDAAQVTNRSSNRRVKSTAARVLPLPKLAGNRVLPPLQEILNQHGDPKKGQSVFFKAESQCSKCHRAAGVGGWIGPDLSQIGGKLAKDGLLDSILNPSAAIAHEYVQYAVETQKGQVHNGLIVEETTDRLILKNAEGERIVLPAKEVASKTALQVSLMPEGLVQYLSDKELVDLLAYLGTLKQPSVIVGEWQVLGPFGADQIGGGPEKGVDLKATYPGKEGARIGWRKLGADREGRLDLEAALGTRLASVYLYAGLQSKTNQNSRLVILLPKEAKAAAWLNGKEVAFQPGQPLADPRAGVSVFAELGLQGGNNNLLLKIIGNDKASLEIVTTVVSPLGVEMVNR